MNKIMSAITIAALCISTPAFARDRDHHRYDYKEHRHKKRNGCGWVCGAIIGGVVVGAIASKERRGRDYDDRNYDNRYYPPDERYDRRYCVREQVTEWYRGERYIYWQTRCN